MEIPSGYVETINDQWGEFIQRWDCDPPAIGVSYKVIRETWNDDFTVRTIHEVKLL